MVKAVLRKAENAVWMLNGRAIKRAWNLSGLSLKEFAGVLERDKRQVARWFLALERPQIETVFAASRLRRHLVIAMAEISGDGIEVVTEIRVPRPS